MARDPGRSRKKSPFAKGGAKKAKVHKGEKTSFIYKGKMQDGAMGAKERTERKRCL